MKILAHILGTALALLVMPHFIQGLTIDSFYTAAIVAVIWGLLSVTIRPILGLFTLPINLITFGLFSFVLNALIFWFLASFIQGFAVAGFIPALLGSAVLAVVSWAINAAFH
ncbi:MAG TPA: phage holin family protein [Candidatus Paceibacterota bacterium]|nr:phage holin family protein [Candidatus Paceibacterota bacterium]